MRPALVDYKNFWLIWINCASRKEGVSLFKVQTEWGIKTNYLYHNEAGLGKPLFKCMVEQGYLEKSGKNLKPRFGWIPGYMAKRYKPLEFLELPDQWFPNKFIDLKWPLVQAFVEKYHETIFDPKKIKLLYRGNKDLLGSHGPSIFTDVFLYVMFRNIMSFTSKYKADVVLRMISTLISLSTEANVINYIHKLHVDQKDIIDMPVLAANENELSRVLCTLAW